ncbi:MAG: type III toxin-antitoxin system ToxN/AbiQ family toxin [Bacilli bacterium]|nr:type III toxin-antitoxin system ToxN/AbiQ family toxin [Bacilli bacterium]
MEKKLNESNEFIYVLDQNGCKKLKRNFTDIIIRNNNNQPVAAVKLNDMVPIPNNLIGLIAVANIKELQLSSESKDRKYGSLLELELEYINRPAVATKIKEKALDYYSNYKINEKYKRVCLDFKLLEQKANDYKIN